MNPRTLLIFFYLSVLTYPAWALDFGCEFIPKQAIHLADKIIKNYYHKQQQIPNTIPLQNQVRQEFTQDRDHSIEQTQYETILRPKKSDYFQLLHLIMFKLERTRHLMYVCFNENSLIPSQNHISIYFLSAYGLEPNSTDRDNFSTLFADWLLGPESLFNNSNSSVVSVARIPIELVPLHYATNGMKDFTENIPIIGKVLIAPSAALQISGDLLNKINATLRAGVERIVITSDKIEFANSIDLDHPEKFTVLYELPLTQ